MNMVGGVMGTSMMTKIEGYTLATNILGKDHSNSLASALFFEPQCPTMSMLGEDIGQL